MKIKAKLYASLQEYLPPNAVKQEAMIDVPDGATPARIILQLGVPKEHCHLVLVNGLFVTPEERDVQTLQEGDTIAMWPPVAGG